MSPYAVQHIDGGDLRDRLSRAVEYQTAESSDFEMNAKLSAPEGEPRAAGVLAAFREKDGALFLTKRPATMRHHPGQIALPGGKVDRADRDARAAALREAQEEIGLDSAQIDILGALPPHRTVTGFSITPVVALIRGEFTPIPEPGEVDEVFTVPFAHISDPANYRIERRLWRGVWRYYRVAPWGPYYIWGATARILHRITEGVHA